MRRGDEMRLQYEITRRGHAATSFIFVYKNLFLKILITITIIFSIIIIIRDNDN